MRVIPTAIPDVLIIEPKVFGDARGFFFESFNQRAFNEATGLNVQFVQDNHSRSSRGVLRGLHYQIEHAQGNWCASCKARASTLLSTSENHRRLSANGWALS